MSGSNRPLRKKGIARSPAWVSFRVALPHGQSEVVRHSLQALALRATQTRPIRSERSRANPAKNVG
jgi:hypothetical protein